MNHRTDVIVLRGLPGIGKTTISTILRDRLAPAARLSVDTIRYLARPRDLSDDTIHLGEAACAAAAETYAAAGLTAIIEGVFADPERLEGLVGRLEGSGLRVTVVTLTGTLDAALARNAGREPELRISEDRIRWLHEGFDDGIGEVVDVGERVAEELAEIVDERISSEVEPPTGPAARKTLFFLRHGLATVPQDRYPDHDSMGLSEVGRRQVRGIGEALRRLAPDALVASPMRRAHETAQIAAEFVGLHVEVDERLRERSFRDLYDMRYDDIAARWGADTSRQLRSNSDDVDIPGGESIEDAAARVVEGVRELRVREERRFLVVAHGGPHEWLFASAIGVGAGTLGRRARLGEARMSAFALDPDGSLSLTAMNARPDGLHGWT